MQRALQLAGQSIGLTDPNPRVGCVLVGKGWTAEGRTQAAGQAHAEAMALRAARAAGHDPRGATAYVTLEPCSHHGRTPPCCDALIDAGVARVVVALGDPNPLVGGRGIERLRAAGIAVDLGLREAEARELNIGFLHRMRTGLPFVRLKAAASMDGRTALDDGRSQWITGPAARADGHAWRRRAGAVLTGIGTVLADDPRLDVREVPTPRQPLRVVLDTQLRLPPYARIVAPPGERLVYTADAQRPAAAALGAAGVTLAAMPLAQGRLDLHAVLRDLGTRGINELHVEAGAALNAAFVDADLVDEWLLYLAPMLVGPGRGLAALAPLPALADARRYAFVECTPVGDDLRLRARRRP
ncbi:MAG: bifunctional diaminohydroxyphosphoribosylaminopyrimidine deaminase/5-amino-6-(5-phosphoribosylamino)uracil reductase RibD [Rubrivivax sp.]